MSESGRNRPRNHVADTAASAGSSRIGEPQIRRTNPNSSERPGAVSADADGRGRVGAVRLLGRRLGPEGRAGLEVVLAAERVAHDMRIRRDDNPLLALRVFDHDAWLAGAGPGKRCTNRTGRLDEAVRHGATGRAGP